MNQRGGKKGWREGGREKERLREIDIVNDQSVAILSSQKELLRVCLRSFINSQT